MKQNILLLILGVLVAGTVLAQTAGEAARTPSEAGDSPPGLQTRFIILWAFCEAVAIYGLVLHFLGYGRETWIGFFIAGAVAMLLCFPLEVVRER